MVGLTNVFFFTKGTGVSAGKFLPLTAIYTLHEVFLQTRCIRKDLNIHHNRIRCECGDSTRTVPNGDQFRVVLQMALNL